MSFEMKLERNPFANEVEAMEGGDEHGNMENGPISQERDVIRKCFQVFGVMQMVTGLISVWPTQTIFIAPSILMSHVIFVHDDSERNGWE